MAAKPPVITTARIEAFSDGVFAIASTLLVLQLNLPPDLGSNPTDAQLTQALLHEAPSYFSFILSFIVIGRYWLVHHQLFDKIERGTLGLASINLFMLLAVVAMPFSTEVMGEYGSLAAATIFYAVSLSLVGLMSYAVWRYAVNHQLVYRSIPKAVITGAGRRSLVVPAVFLASVPIALVDVTAAQWFWLLAFIIALFWRRD